MRKELRDFRTLCLKHNLRPATAKDMFRMYRPYQARWDTDKETHLRIIQLSKINPTAIEESLKAHQLMIPNLSND